MLVCSNVLLFAGIKLRSLWCVFCFRDCLENLFNRFSIMRKIIILFHGWAWLLKSALDTHFN